LSSAEETFMVAEGAPVPFPVTFTAELNKKECDVPSWSVAEAVCVKFGEATPAAVVAVALGASVKLPDALVLPVRVMA